MTRGDSTGRGEQVEGRRAVAELLRAGRRRVRTVFVARNVDADPLVDEIVDRAGDRLQSVAPDRIAAMAATDAPQGVIARADALRDVDPDELLRATDAFLVALDGVTDPHNLGAVLRAAETAGATGAILPRHRSARLTPVVAKAAAGALEYLPIATVAGIPAFLERAKRAKVWSVGLDERGEQSVYDLAFLDDPVVVVLGAEGRGLARLTRDRCDVLAHIPMHGSLASLNVATAAAVACHAIARTRSVVA